MKRLVVVESPTKAKTIRSFLPAGFKVEASMGHIRDLPRKASEIPQARREQLWEHYGVDVDNGFAPVYVTPPDKQKVVRKLRAALKEADELYIATDEDREGESIGWHLVEALSPKIPVRRMVFHEITQEAIQRALRETRDIDRSLVDAQETRRILDRLVGYSISPLLWRKIAPKLSAGRVQSVATRLLVQREKQRMVFVPAIWLDLKASLSAQDQPFPAEMTHYGGVRLAAGKDFDDHTGRLREGLEPGKDLVLLGEEQARALVAALPDRAWRVVEVEERMTSPSPPPPFITSTLQQEGSRKLRFSARRTMQVAQRLYEQGLITYMRTDSTQLSDEAIRASRKAVAARYGKDYLPAKPRRFGGKVANAQEAHEAIRPAGSDMKTRDELGLSGEEADLYELIWKRTVAGQMANARVRRLAVRIEAGEGEEAARFRASGQQVEFQGFYRAYVEGSDDPDAALEHRDRPLPPMAEGDELVCREVESVEHETKPPARYTEATLVRMLEKEGIGRPSTYASIIDTIVRREYVRRAGSQLAPTFTAFAAVQLLEDQFANLVDVGFTADMEQILDDIATGDRASTGWLEDFYLGDEGLVRQVQTGQDRIDPRKISTISSPKWTGFVVRTGKYGPYVEGEVNGAPARASIPRELSPGDLSAEALQSLLETSSNGSKEHPICAHPDSGLDVLLCQGPYGPYVQLGRVEDVTGKPKRVSLPKDTPPEAVDSELALALLELPRSLGAHPETGKPVLANIGRYGPYVQHERTFVSLTEGDDVLFVDLDRALALLAQPKRGAGPLRVLGEHPKTGDPVDVRKGRYGPYVKHGKVNASIPKTLSPEEITLEEALGLLAEKAASGGRTQGGRRGSGRRRSARK